MALRNHWEQILDQIRSLPFLLPPWLTNPRKHLGSQPELLFLITLLVGRAASNAWVRSMSDKSFPPKRADNTPGPPFKASTSRPESSASAAIPVWRE